MIYCLKVFLSRIAEAQHVSYAVLYRLRYVSRNDCACIGFIAVCECAAYCVVAVFVNELKRCSEIKRGYSRECCPVGTVVLLDELVGCNLVYYILAVYSGICDLSICR